MAARSGVSHHHAGPHLPATVLEPPRESLADPAKGAKVPRCYECGMPNPYEGTVVWNGIHGRIRWCERCFFLHNPPDPRGGDQLTLVEVAG